VLRHADPDGRVEEGVRSDAADVDQAFVLGMPGPAVILEHVCRLLEVGGDEGAHARAKRRFIGRRIRKRANQEEEDSHQPGARIRPRVRPVRCDVEVIVREPDAVDADVRRARVGIRRADSGCGVIPERSRETGARYRDARVGADA
jgi:hypothetical protein